jgi:hypothetical protein
MNSARYRIGFLGFVFGDMGDCKWMRWVEGWLVWRRQPERGPPKLSACARHCLPSLLSSTEEEGHRERGNK